jgi:hypothetical protein
LESNPYKRSDWVWVLILILPSFEQIPEIPAGCSETLLNNVGPKSKPRLLPTKRVEEGNRVSKEERKEAEQEKFDKIPKKVLQNGMVQGMVERVHKNQDAGQDFM